jgi:HD superfamily phosphohydrolase
MAIKYPNQITTIKRNKKVLGVDAKLVLPTQEELDSGKSSPLEMHSGFSRFEFSLIDKEKNIVPVANIPAVDVSYIKVKTDAIINSLNKQVSLNEEILSDDIAYTQPLFDKTFKGMTPAQVLLKDPNNADKLKEIKNWLSANLDKYPNNKKQIDAIDNALDLLDADLLKDDSAKQNTSSITIYEEDFKYKSKVNEKGYNLIYKISVTYNSAMRYPYSIKICNGYAPVETFANGQKNIKLQQATDMVESSIVIDEKEWYTVVYKMFSTLTNFESLHFLNQYQIAKDNSYKKQ